MFNRIILIGNLTRDPEVRHPPGGTPVATISIAVNSRYKQGDDTKEEVLFISAAVFGKQAESCGKYLSKGNPVLIEGRSERGNGRRKACRRANLRSWRAT